MNDNVITDTLSDLNRKFSLQEYKNLKPALRVVFKNDLKKAMERLKKGFTIKMLEDDYLFALTATRASFSMMQMINEYREVSHRLGHSWNSAQENAENSRSKREIRDRVLEGLFQSRGLLFNRVDDRTIAVDPEILSQFTK
ncbi:hypothetical protein KK062_12225 [Fulvivirgaceae bacterium PWU5]|uniref:Uncharacterized protein n=1 Tax=Dawidia cretensis TaxID=2782350 RepID=A0AAP2DX19_9BACT|nr:hypothetical protein [Dawidia cretensis]MBT1708998.1 hypothetical protein [Dawidia cretensis]